MTPRHGSASRPLGRREFLGGVAAGGALLAGCAPDARESAARQEPWVKDPTAFIRHPTNLETRLEDLRGFLTPTDRFFVRNHAPTPTIDTATYRLVVEGDAVPRPLTLTYDELLAMPSHSVIAYVECAGNWRKFFAEVLGRAAQGSPWGTGAVGCAEWTGVPLAAVLERAGVRTGATDVNLIGLDTAEFQRPMPLATATDGDTILAYAMNGATLPPDHGFPVRAIVPGWVGSNSIKWVGRIVVSAQRIWTRTNTSSYVLVGAGWPPQRYAPADGGPITVQTVKSALALPRPARLPAGRHVLRGFAHSGHGVIARVEWSADGGATWQAAQLVAPVLPHAWARFEFAWEARAGFHTLLTRATDRAGHTQPRTAPFNEKGYLLNVTLPHPVEVA